MDLELKGSERKKLREIFEDAFDRAPLTRALRESSPSRELENLVTPGPFSNQVSELIKNAEEKGWLDELVALLEEERPGRTDLIEDAHAILERARTRPAADAEERRVTDREATESQPMLEAPVHNLPYLSLGDLFQGRDAVIDALAASPTGPTAIHGLGGIGKTRPAFSWLTPSGRSACGRASRTWRDPISWRSPSADRRTTRRWWGRCSAGCGSGAAG